ncbi:PucR family transcriptional regulator [Aeromicrobium camelliae]|uniref:PucR family transcriptional regulator n=1 Tax=Aeromicrobium camelliae TaxID=1538144 RepID=A0A3N6X7P6_9ACTN|nr:helix-turn-helix domain-containing protein [Aeromicrobium camelliae]RQN09658.1 PucR family transcriptional regulator [Aeromicrobium camelliae]
MTALREDGGFEATASSLVPLFRPQLPELVARITQDIQTNVPAYAGPAHGRRHRLITLAVNGAVSHFLDLLEGGGTSGDRVDDLFRKMGYGEALGGHDLSAMRASYRIARHQGWEYLRSFAVAQELSAETLGLLGDALLAYIDHLTEQASIGWRTARETIERDRDRNRRRLVVALLEGRNSDVPTLAAHAGWEIPDRFVVLAVAPRRRRDSLELPDLGPSAIVNAGPDSAAVLTAPDGVDAVMKTLRSASPAVRFAFSWPVARPDLPDAHRWVIRALELGAAGVITDGAVIDCGRHRTQLWLHSEPALRRGMVQELLRPLLAETPNSREILSETLLAWLETRDSAPAIAGRLGVHPQTVRYRWKRINEIFGEALHDPDFIVQITMLLKASVPLWKAGDQSDFERFHAEENA